MSEERKKLQLPERSRHVPDIRESPPLLLLSFVAADTSLRISDLENRVGTPVKRTISLISHCKQLIPMESPHLFGETVFFKVFFLFFLQNFFSLQTKLSEILTLGASIMKNPTMTLRSSSTLT